VYEILRISKNRFRKTVGCRIQKEIQQVQGQQDKDVGFHSLEDEVRQGELYQ
jgi:hypothetical protein